MNGIYDATSGGVKLWNNGGNCLQDGKYWNSSNQWKYPGNVDLYYQYTPNTYTNTITHWMNGLTNSEGNNGDQSHFRLTSTSFNVTYKDTFGGGPAQFTMDSGRQIAIPNGLSLASDFGTSSISGSWSTYAMPKTVNQQPFAMGFEYYYAPINYTITYDLNDATGSPASTATNSPENPSTYNVFYGFTLKEPTRTGYKFTGWKDQYGNIVTTVNQNANMSFLSSANGLDDVTNELAKRRAENITLTAQWTPTSPELVVRKTSYYRGVNVTADILKKNATATDILEGDISDKVVIKSIQYVDGTVVENPIYLDTSVEGNMKVTYYVENQRGGKIEKSQIVTIIPQVNHPESEDNTNTTNPGNGVILDEDYTSQRIFARYINKDSLYTLPGNSKWKTEGEYNSILGSMNKASDEYLSEYDSLLND